MNSVKVVVWEKNRHVDSPVVDVRILFGHVANVMLRPTHQRTHVSRHEPLEIGQVKTPLRHLPQGKAPRDPT